MRNVGLCPRKNQKTMEELITQLQGLIDAMEHDEIEYTEVKEALQEIFDDANTAYMKDVLPF